MKVNFVASFFVLCIFSCGKNSENSLDKGDAKTPISGNSYSIDSDSYYKTYSGHEESHLETVYRGLKEGGCKYFIFHAGDSSLDNKLWIKTWDKAVNGYEKILQPPKMKTDVDYWINRALADKNGDQVCSLMTAVEASTLAQRKQKLLPQDSFIQKHITSKDYLIVSVGGNDVALAPSEDTKAAVQALQKDPNDAKAFAHILSIVGDETKKYIEKLIQHNKPKKIIINMIYYPDEADVSSWANPTLAAFNYSKEPQKLQKFLDELFKKGTQNIVIPGVEIIPLALSQALDGRTSSDYVSRIEPSELGGKKMAKLFMDKLFGHN